MGNGFISNYNYIVGPVERFDQKNEMFKRARWDPSVRHVGEKIYGIVPPRDKDGYGLKDRALHNASWYLELGFAQSLITHNWGLYEWQNRPSDIIRLPKGSRLDVSDPAKMSQEIKKVARLFGACEAGITELDRRWIYSHTFNLRTLEHSELEVPEGCKYAIALAVEMDYEAMKSAPTNIAGVATGLGYSKMAFVAGLLAYYIRNLGYTAIPSGNDTALSIPISIDAGLGELGRNGLLITRRFGPRVRLAKVLTDMPLASDKPIEFGARQFCQVCRKCAGNCPSQAIQHGEPTEKAVNVSNNPGVLKWPVDAEKCYGFWASDSSNCGNCIRVCPFNKPATGLLHSSVRWGVKNAPWLDSLFLRGDGLLGYEKQRPAAEFWD